MWLRQQRLAPPLAVREADGRYVFDAGCRPAQDVEAVRRDSEADAGRLEHRLLACPHVKEQSLHIVWRYASQRVHLGAGEHSGRKRDDIQVRALEGFDIDANLAVAQERAGDAAARMRDADIDARGLTVDQLGLLVARRLEADRRWGQTDARGEERPDDPARAEVLRAAQAVAEAGRAVEFDRREHRRPEAFSGMVSAYVIEDH